MIFPVTTCLSIQGAAVTLTTSVGFLVVNAAIIKLGVGVMSCRSERQPQQLDTGVFIAASMYLKQSGRL